MVFDLSKCSGCSACMQVCPKDAISWCRDEEGFSFPKVDEAVCVDCGLCRKVCPYETERSDADPEIYAAVHKDPKVLRRSSSGGAFTAFSDWILKNQGVVYGVAYDRELSLHYRRAVNEEQRNAFRGSKYLQCTAEGMFPLVEKDLRSGKMVLFTGTPCQISGLLAVMEQKKVPTEKLYVIDNICHGVASPLVWQEYRSYIRKKILKGKTIRHFSMRSKRTAWQKQYLECFTEVGNESAVLNEKASWNKLYLTSYFTRKSCFSCRFTSFDRVGDITLADFWNIENAGVSLNYADGVSLVLVNSKKGRELLDACRDQLILEKSSRKACWQIHLERPAPMSSKREQVWERFRQDPEGTVAACSRGSVFSGVSRVVTPVLRKLGLYTLVVRTFSVVKSYGKKT